MVTPEGFGYYVDRSAANDTEDDYLPMIDLDYEDSEDEETELDPEFFGCTQEFSSLVGGGEIDMRELDSIHRIFAECLAEDNLRANLIE